MPGELALSPGMLIAFLLVLARISGVFVFVPLPGVQSGPDIARIFLSLALTVALFPAWPRLAGLPSTGQMTGWLLEEAALGVTIGLAVGLISEIFLIAAQIAGLQAGFGFASTVDPVTQADSTVLLQFAQVAAGLLFFALDLHHDVLRVLARSLEAAPPGSFMLDRGAAAPILRLGAEMFSTGVRLALPVIALLALVDIALALLGRVNAQLQLLTMAFPLKMLAALLVLSWTAVLMPAIFRQIASHMLAALREALRI